MNTHPASSRHSFAQSSLATDDMFAGMFELIRAALLMAPDKIKPFKPFNHSKWVLTASGRLVRQFRELGMTCQGAPHTEEVTGIISDEPEALTSQAMTHAWMLAIAQRTAVDIRQIELMDSPRAYASHDAVEINGVGLFAGCIRRDGCSERLSAALQNVARRTLELCDARGVRAQFVTGAPIQSVSPLTKQTGLPFTSCRVRAEGMSTSELLDVLRTAVRCAGGAENQPTGELLVMSNLWLDARS